MPGHKGVSLTGLEERDITEIDGADYLYAPNGIIAQSERNASELFGADTYYSAEGSSLSIRAMMRLVAAYAAEQGRSRTVIAAARNCHKAFITAAALLDLDVDFIMPEEYDSYISASISPERLDEYLSKRETKPDAVYLTSPDYLGNMLDIAGLASVCKRHRVLLTVDNAHGAYLKFLSPSRHPIELGADICCDSAHKTLPVLTGGGYLHLSRTLPPFFRDHAQKARALFGSTSPSYLILQSLDATNAYISNGYAARLAEFEAALGGVKRRLNELGYILLGDEPLKITVSAAERGYTGDELAELLLRCGIVCEFHDTDYIVLMLTPENTQSELERIQAAFAGIPQRMPRESCKPALHNPMRAMSIREAAFARKTTLPTRECIGRVIASLDLSCPPAVMPVVCGEIVDEAAAELLYHNGIEKCEVVAE